MSRIAPWLRVVAAVGFGVAVFFYGAMTLEAVGADMGGWVAYFATTTILAGLGCAYLIASLTTRPLGDRVSDFKVGWELRHGRCFVCSKRLGLRGAARRWAGMACSPDCWATVRSVLGSAVEQARVQ